MSGKFRERSGGRVRKFKQRPRSAGLRTLLLTLSLSLDLSIFASADRDPLPGCFPLLPHGLHVTSAYNAPSDSHSNAAARKAWGEFTASTTIDSWNVAFTWEQLEPFPGEINVSYVADVMRTLHQVGYRSMVGIHVLQGKKITVPLDMQAQEQTAHAQSVEGGSDHDDGTHAQGLRAGLTWSSPELQQRFHAMLKVALPTIAYYGAYHINVASRFDQHLRQPHISASAFKGSDRPKQNSSSSASEFNQMAPFLRHAQQSIQLLTDSRMSMGVTLSQRGLAHAHGSNAPWLRALHDIVHNTPVEYAPVLAPAAGRGTADIPSMASPLFDIPALLGPLLPPRMCLALIQVSYPSITHGQNTAIPSQQAPAEEDQAQFIADVLSAARASQTHMPGRLRVLSGAHLVDRAPASCADEAQSHCWPCSRSQLAAALPVAAQQCSGGLLRADGSPKPAWHAWIEGVRRLKVGGVEAPSTVWD